MNEDIDKKLQNVFQHFIDYCKNNSIFYDIVSDEPYQQGYSIKDKSKGRQLYDFMLPIIKRNKVVMRVNDEGSNCLFTFTLQALQDAGHWKKYNPGDPISIFAYKKDEKAVKAGKTMYQRKFHQLSTIDDDQYRFGTRKMIEKQSSFRASIGPSKSFGGIDEYPVISSYKRKVRMEDVVPSEIKKLIKSAQGTWLCPHCNNEIKNDSIYSKGSLDYCMTCKNQVLRPTPQGNQPLIEPGTDISQHSAQRSNASGEPKEMKPYNQRKNTYDLAGTDLGKIFNAGTTVIPTDTASLTSNPINALAQKMQQGAGQIGVPLGIWARGPAAPQNNATGSNQSPPTSNVAVQQKPGVNVLTNPTVYGQDWSSDLSKMLDKILGR